MASYTLYTVYPKRLKNDQWSDFRSHRWQNLNDLNEIQLHISGVNAHISLVIGERLHSILRLLLEK